MSPLPAGVTPLDVEEAPLLMRLARCRREGERLVMDPGSFVELRDDWAQVVSPGSTHFVQNTVLRCRLGAAAADERIAQVTVAADARGGQLRWIVGASSTPHDLPDRLVRAGFAPTVTARALAAAPASVTARVHPGVEVREVDVSSVDLWARVSREGFGVPADAPDPFSDEFHWVATHGREYRYFVAWLDGEPAGVGAVALVSVGGYLISACVRPAFRRRGVYESLLAARAALLRDRGARVAIVHAGDESASVCARHGFEDVSFLRTFVRAPRSPA